MKNIRYTAYYYDDSKNQMSGIDTNELYFNGKYIGEITEVRSSFNLDDLMPKTELEKIILITTPETEMYIKNINPCPEEL